MYVMIICHWAILHYNMSFKTIAGRSDGVLRWFPTLSEDQEKNCQNSPKLSCGFNRDFEHLFFILYFDSYSATNKSTLPLLFHFENIPFELTRVRDEEVDWCLWGGCREGVEEAARTPCLGQGGGTFTLVEHIHIVAWSCHKRHTNPWLFYLWLTLLISHQKYIYSFFIIHCPPQIFTSLVFYHLEYFVWHIIYFWYPIFF